MYLASPAYSELANPFEQTEGWDLILRVVREVTLAARALESKHGASERGAGENEGNETAARAARSHRA